MPKLISPPITPARSCVGVRKAPSHSKPVTSKKRKLNPGVQPTKVVESDFIKLSSPLKSPHKLTRCTPKLTSPLKKKRALFSSINPDLGKANIRNFRPVQNLCHDVDNLEELCKLLIADAKEIMEDRHPKLNSEETFQLVDQFHLQFNTGDGIVGKNLLLSLEDVVRSYLEKKVQQQIPRDKIGLGTTSFFVSEWKEYMKKVALLCSLFSPLDPPPQNSSSSQPSSPNRSNWRRLKDRLVPLFNHQLIQPKQAIFLETTKRMEDLREAASLDVDDSIRSLREMLTQDSGDLYRQLCLGLRQSLEAWYHLKFQEQTAGTPVEFLDYLTKVVAYEEEITRLVLSESLMEEFRNVLTSQAAFYLDQMAVDLFKTWDVEEDAFSHFTETSKKFLSDRNLLTTLLKFFRKYWSARMKPLLQLNGSQDEIPEKLLQSLAEFEVWKADVGLESPKVMEAITPMLVEVVNANMPPTAQIQTLMGAFAQLVASHAWNDQFSNNFNREAQLVVEYLKLFKEIDAFESSLRSLTVNYFVQNKPPEDYQSAYIRSLQDSLTACFSIDWTAFNSVLVELELSKSFTVEFQKFQSTSHLGRSQNFTASLLKSSSVAHCFNPVAITIPPEIASAAQDFHLFFIKHAKKNLTFISGVGNCTLIGHNIGVSGGVTIKASLPQAVLLLAFNDHLHLSFSQLKIRTGLEAKELFTELKALHCLIAPVTGSSSVGMEKIDPEKIVYGLSKTLLKNRRISFLPGFERNGASNLVNVSGVKEQNSTGLLEWKLKIEIVVIRLMKARRSLSFQALLKEMQIKFPDLQSGDLKLRVEALADRQYLCWKNADQLVVEYLP